MRRWPLLLLAAFPCLALCSSHPGTALFDANSDHPANRLSQYTTTRTTPEGEVYDEEGLDPVFGPKSEFLTAGISHEKVLALLDDFLASQAKQPIKDPLKRAVLQHDLWGVFLTTTGAAQQELLETPEGRLVKTPRFLDAGDENLPRPRQRRELQRRLVAALRSLALTAKEIDALPDNYADAVRSKAYPSAFDPDRMKQPFLPADLLASNGPWRTVTNSTRPDAVAAPAHLAFTKGRSFFTVFLRLPGGRPAADKLLGELADAEKNGRNLPPLPEGAETALLRQMVLINSEGKMRATRLTESLELRVYHKTDLGHPFAFKLRRADLFAGRNGGLRAVAEDEKTYFDFQVFGGHSSDPFEMEAKKRSRALTLMSTCTGCHARIDGRAMHSVNTLFTGDERRLGLVASDGKEQAEASIKWHQQTYTWGLLQGLWAGPRER